MKTLSRKQRIRARRLAWRRSMTAGQAMIWCSPECGRDHFAKVGGLSDAGRKLKPETWERIRLGIVKYIGPKAITTHKLTAFVPDTEYIK